MEIPCPRKCSWKHWSQEKHAGIPNDYFSRRELARTKENYVYFLVEFFPGRQTNNPYHAFGLVIPCLWFCAMLSFPLSQNSKTHKHVLFLKRNSHQQPPSYDTYRWFDIGSLKGEKSIFPIFLHPRAPPGLLPPRSGPGVNAMGAIFQIHY